MNPPELEVLHRNARLRAWRAVGVPVEGGWAQIQGVLYPRIFCAVCGSPGIFQGGFAYLAPTLGLGHAEREHLIVYCARRACSHLDPLLLGLDPTEVQAITELELLAGGVA